MAHFSAIDNGKMAFSITDACSRLGLSRSTIWKLAKEGKLRLIRIGGRTLVPTTELLRLLDQK
ncbi:MAG: helix-turn-helix domain-containing protein [Beijerinckiaceae bacterium]|nr:helix-turn-helix domain-containing protein [Beijerinckiaceae bacterium]MBX9758003.1 helix-turn-helix domain-containing protein [Beijerinckiaceae bacterium]